MGSNPSTRNILHEHFAHLFDVKIVLFVRKRRKMNEKEAEIMSGNRFYGSNTKLFVDFGRTEIQTWDLRIKVRDDLTTKPIQKA